MDFLLKLVIGMTVLATIAAVNEGDGDLVKMFAKERKEMREERKEMREEQKEMRADFRREIDEQKKQNDEQNRFIAELHNRNDEQKKQNDEQNRFIAEQKEEMKRLHKKLHQADVKIQKTNRQRDEKQSQELEATISSAIRQSSELEDVVESVVKRSIRRGGKNNTNSSLEIELRKLMDHQIDQYLINQRICVAGKYANYGFAKQELTQTVNFGYEFPRTPTVSASLARVWNNKERDLHMEVNVASVTRSSAIIKSYAGYGSGADLIVSWLACL